jgi:hypothetical protein
MSCTVWLSFIGDENVWPWSVDRTKYTLELKPFELPPVNRAHAKYTLPSHAPPVRSTSIEVLSWNLPSRFGAADPCATSSERTNSLPSAPVGPF